ncbi:hypothetical protein DL93DRAFT_1824687 [Clavulina sp. PMI_390]|nr:hypothetical protein DL93DRAFT_1824687 [Clavulina sp. PMI_390]
MSVLSLNHGDSSRDLSRRLNAAPGSFLPAHDGRVGVTLSTSTSHYQAPIGQLDDKNRTPLAPAGFILHLAGLSFTSTAIIAIWQFFINGSAVLLLSCPIWIERPYSLLRNPTTISGQIPFEGYSMMNSGPHQSPAVNWPRLPSR